MRPPPRRGPSFDVGTPITRSALTGGRYVGEDFAFRDRWRALGGTVWIDPEIALQHIGSRAGDATLMQALSPSKGKG